MVGGGRTEISMGRIWSYRGSDLWSFGICSFDPRFGFLWIVVLLFCFVVYWCSLLGRPPSSVLTLTSSSSPAAILTASTTCLRTSSRTPWLQEQLCGYRNKYTPRSYRKIKHTIQNKRNKYFTVGFCNAEIYFGTSLRLYRFVFFKNVGQPVPTVPTLGRAALPSFPKWSRSTTGVDCIYYECGYIYAYVRSSMYHSTCIYSRMHC